MEEQPPYSELLGLTIANNLVARLAFDMAVKWLEMLWGTRVQRAIPSEADTTSILLEVWVIQPPGLPR